MPNYNRNRVMNVYNVKMSVILVNPKNQVCVYHAKLINSFIVKNAIRNVQYFNIIRMEHLIMKMIIIVLIAMNPVKIAMELWILIALGVTYKIFC